MEGLVIGSALLQGFGREEVPFSHLYEASWPPKKGRGEEPPSSAPDKGSAGSDVTS